MNDLPIKPNSDLLWSRDVNSPRLCFVNKDGGGVNDLPCKPNSDLLWSRDLNSPRLCYVNNEVDSVTPYLTCYSKQRRHFKFAAIWRTRVLRLNFIILKLLLLSRDVNSPRLCYVNNEVDSVTPYLTLTCYYFETLLWSRDVNRPRLCYVNNEVDSDAVLNFNLLW